MTYAPRIDSYRWAGGQESMLRFGAESGPVVIAAMPLLEEANRTRGFVVTLLRLLAERGIGGALPDLPGQGDSLAPTSSMTLADLSTAFAAASPAGARTIAMRSGAMLDGSAQLRWHFAPQTGPELAREWSRLKEIGGSDAIAGNLVSSRLLSELEQDQGPPPDRTVRLSGDPRAANRHVEGVPLWRRAEPDNDRMLAAILADDIADWITTCGG
jgi:hypothetical protein